MVQPNSTSETPWHATFPTPSFESPRMSHEALAEMMDKKKAGVDYMVVDVRRTDFEVSLSVHIMSLNI